MYHIRAVFANYIESSEVSTDNIADLNVAVQQLNEVINFLAADPSEEV